MPRIIVKIEWNKPNDSNWLNKHNIKLALRNYCPNTQFLVNDIEDIKEVGKIKRYDFVYLDGNRKVIDRPYYEERSNGEVVLYKDIEKMIKT